MVFFIHDHIHSLSLSKLLNCLNHLQADHKMFESIFVMVLWVLLEANDIQPFLLFVC